MHHPDNGPICDSALRARPSLSPNERKALDPRQVAEIYRECLALYAQNRINTRNAFDLKLIDLLSELKHGDPRRMDFSFIGKLIAVAAKIYACRVDYICQQTHQLYNEVLRSEYRCAGSASTVSRSGYDKNSQAADGSGDVDRKVNPKAQKAPLDNLKLDCMIEKDISKVTITDDDGRAETGPVYFKTKDILAKYPMATAMCNTLVLTNDFGAMDMTSRWSGSTASSNFPENLDCDLEPLRKALKSIVDNEKEDEASVLSSRFKYADATAVPSTEEFVQQLFLEANSNTLDATLNTSVDDVLLDVTITEASQPMFELNALAAASANCDEVMDCSNDIYLDYASVFSSLSRRPLEYSYIRAETLPIICGAKDWKDVLHKLKKITAHCREVRRRRKADVVSFDLNFESSTAFFAEANRGPKETTLKRAELDKLTFTKYSMDPEIDYDPKRLSCFSLLPNKGMIRTNSELLLRKFLLVSGNRLLMSHAGRDELPHRLADSANTFPAVLNTVQEEDDAGMNEQSIANDEPNEPLELSPPSQQELATLARAKRVDIPHIKKIISLLLTKRTKVDNGEENGDRFRPLDFTRIYRVLARQPKLKNDISVHIAFLCMLHMCNENSYRLLPKGVGDFTVTRN
uniref:Condensin complex subunit 2 n=1 Tax=Trichuris muris TaxID=70415 RepID=A0A5S6QUJ5_TRIMR